MTAERDRIVRCPRCGYDQRGRVPDLDENPALCGTCPECGLLFEWRELLDPRLGLPAWCVESDGPGRGLVRRVLGTYVRTYVPWRFWSALKMSHPERWGRLVGYCLVLAVVLYLVFAVSVGLQAWGEWWSVSSNGWLKSNVSPGRVFTQAVLLPLSDRSPGTYERTPSVGTWPFAPPLQYTRYLLQTWAPAVLYAVLGHLCCALTFAALPVSRRIAKVRAGHVMRVTLYGFALLLLPCALAPIALASQSAGLPGMMTIAGVTIAAWAALLPLEIVWWSIATGRYLKMRHAWGVGVAVVVIGALAPITVAAKIADLL